MNLNPEAWRTSTPESISGDTKLVGQLSVFPAELPFAHTAGNHSSPGRRTVGSSRGRILNSCHLCGECLDSDKVTPMWKQYIKTAKEQHRKGSVMYQEVFCDNGEVPLAPIASSFSSNLDEHHAFDVLLEAIRDLTAFISEVHRSDPKFIQKYATQTGSSMFDTLLSCFNRIE